MLSEIAGLLLSKTRLAVLTHNSADGDTLGSALAVSLALRKLGKDVSLIYEEEYPDYLSFLLKGKDFFIFLPDNPGILECTWDAVAVFDTADPKLLGERERLLKQTGCVVNIDHHITNDGYGDYNHVDVGVSSAAELAYELNDELGVPMDRDIAVALYTGICTETGGFSYNNTTCASHEIAAKTLRFGIDVAHLRYKFFDEISPGKLRCHAFVANTLKFHGDGKYAIAIVSAATLLELGATEADCEGLVNIGRNVVGVTVSIFAREIRPGEFRINLRSREDFDVAAMAREFGGGGHKLAAGCTICAEAPEVESMLLNALYARGS